VTNLEAAHDAFRVVGKVLRIVQVGGRRYDRALEWFRLTEEGRYQPGPWGNRKAMRAAKALSRRVQRARVKAQRAAASS
jgi:hypothetical protein